MSQLLFYNTEKDEMRVYDCCVCEVKRMEDVPLDCTSLEDTVTKTMYIPSDEATAVFNIREVVAELDPTTMKRIAKYNKDKELEELNYKIQSAEDMLKGLNEEMAEKEKKLELMQELLRQIWEDDCFDEAMYSRTDKYDYDEDDWNDYD